MSMLFSVWTVVVAVIFLGIVIWTLRRSQSQEFEEAARIPLDDDDDPESATTQHNGGH